MNKNTDESPLIDEMLVIVIKAIEQKKIEPFTITLLVNGLVVTGKIIDYDEWAGDDSDTDSIENQPEKDNESEINESLSSPPDEENKSEEERKITESRKFIHLKNAHIVTSNSQLPNDEEGMSLRIKLSTIDGWWEGGFVFSKKQRESHIIKVNGQTIEIK